MNDTERRLIEIMNRCVFPDQPDRGATEHLAWMAEHGFKMPVSLGALRDELASLLNTAESGPWCQPGDVPERRWLLVFEDPDRGSSVYDNEAEARADFEQAKVAWNCFLFAAAPALPLPVCAWRRHPRRGMLDFANPSLPVIRCAWCPVCQPLPDPKCKRLSLQAERSIAAAKALGWVWIGGGDRMGWNCPACAAEDER